jgi:nicotinamidase-related amidase
MSAIPPDDLSSELLALGSSPRNQWRVNAQQCDLVRTRAVPQPLLLPALPQDLTIDLCRTAVVVIDMQNDFCHPKGWLASVGVEVAPARAPIAPLQALLPALRAQGVPVLWVNWGNRPDKLNLSPSALHVYNRDGRSLGLGDALISVPTDALAEDGHNRVLQADSWGAAVVDELVKAHADISVDKFRMSGFYDTCLDSVLRNLDIKTVLFAGVNADQCVLATLMDANFLGYDCVLLEDCTATTSPAFCWDATLYNVRQCFGFTTQSNGFLP